MTHGKRINWTDDMRETVRRMWWEDASNDAIGAALGISGASVFNEAQRMGLPKRLKGWKARLARERYQAAREAAGTLPPLPSEVAR